MNPLHTAWYLLTGQQPPADTRPIILARILAFQHDFTPKDVGMEIFQECLDEILYDPDTYNDEELQLWASYQRFNHPVPAKSAAAAASRC